MEGRFQEIGEYEHMRRVGNGENRFHRIRVTDMDDAVGKDNEGRPKYVVELEEVDLDSIPEANIKRAIESAGWKDMPNTPEAKAECCFGYGCYAPLHSVETNNATRGFRECRKESYELTRDSRRWQERLNRPVNGIGSTAREYMQGDLAAPLTRGVQAGDPKAELMAKLYGAKPETIEQVKNSKPSGAFAASIKMHHPDLIKASGGDSLAYAMGFMHGAAGSALDDDREELAKAYLDGFKHGVAVRVGEAPKPLWVT